MRNVSHMLARKGSNVTTVLPSTTVLDALKMMADQNIGSVVVMEDDIFLGIMTERDYSRKVILKGKSSTDTTVAEIMSSEFPSIKKNDSIEYCMELLSAQNLRYLPVMENGRLAGIISINDVVKETIMEHEVTISHLQTYIQS
ncbi:CBS domain-containing protein [Danxiaibacter flavus]|uniref:CBS domain-containing protein n=1 Tax=Danxiaibacter flavus TaxID=3049108 RepID=A0ABV3Z9R6_9BACT|nr:CBS domain-containing protein [Chitinophagaceae bacterium DXS]